MYTPQIREGVRNIVEGNARLNLSVQLYTSYKLTNTALIITYVVYYLSDYLTDYHLTDVTYKPFELL